MARGAQDSQAKERFLQFTQHDLAFRELVGGTGPIISFLVIGARGIAGLEDLLRQQSWNWPARVKVVHEMGNHARELEQSIAEIVGSLELRPVSLLHSLA